jgi:hypothetical protein
VFCSSSISSISSNISQKTQHKSSYIKLKPKRAINREAENNYSTRHTTKKLSQRKLKGNFSSFFLPPQPSLLFNSISTQLVVIFSFFVLFDIFY